MSDSKRRTAFVEPEAETLDSEIARYEAMSDEEVHAELAAHGIDPAPTVAAVTMLVSTRLKAWRARRRASQRTATRGSR